TIVAGNEGPQCTVTDALGSTTWTSGGTNLFGDDACPAVASDLVAADPLLGELGSAGGAVPGHLPDLASPAVDAAQDAWCPAVARAGTARPQAAAGGGCDIGAIERLATPTGSGPGDPAGPGSPGGPG